MLIDKAFPSPSRAISPLWVLVFCILYFLMGSLSLAGASPNGTLEPAAQETSAEEVAAAALKKQVAELESAIAAVTDVHGQVLSDGLAILEQFKQWEKEFNALTTLYQLSRSNPQQVDDVTVSLTVLTSSNFVSKVSNEES